MATRSGALSLMLMAGLSKRNRLEPARAGSCVGPLGPSEAPARASVPSCQHSCVPSSARPREIMAHAGAGEARRGGACQCPSRSETGLSRRGRGMSLALIPDPAADGRRTATCYDQCASLFLSACTLAPTGPVLVASFLDLAQDVTVGCRSRRGSSVASVRRTVRPWIEGGKRCASWFW